MKKTIVTLLALATLFMLTACSIGNRNNANSNNRTTQTGNAQQNGQGMPNDSDESDLFALSDTAKLGDWEISVTDFTFTDRINTDGGYLYYTPDGGNQYLIVSLSIANSGTEAHTFLPMVQTFRDVSTRVRYADEYEYIPEMFISVNDDLNNSTINPLASKDGIIAFSLPDAVVNSEDTLSIEFSAGMDSVEFALR